INSPHVATHFNLVTASADVHQSSAFHRLELRSYPQQQRKHTPRPDLAGYPNRSTQRFCKFLTQAQSQSGAAIVTGRSSVELAKLLENNLLIFLFDANAGVRDGNLHDVLSALVKNPDEQLDFSLFGK